MVDISMSPGCSEDRSICTLESSEPIIGITTGGRHCQKTETGFDCTDSTFTLSKNQKQVTFKTAKGHIGNITIFSHDQKIGGGTFNDKLLNEAVTTALAVKNKTQKLMALHSIIDCLVTSGQYDRARSVAQRLPDAFDRIETLIGIPSTERDIKSLTDKGIAIIRATGGFEKAHKMDRLTKVLCTFGFGAEARRATKVIYDYNLLSDELLEAIQQNNFELATALVNGLPKETIQDIYRRDVSFAAISEQAIKVGNFEESKKAINQIQNLGEKALSLSFLAKSKSDRVLFDESIALANTYENAYKGGLFHNIYENLVEAKLYDDAASMLQTCQYLSDKGNLWDDLVTEVARTGDYNLAIKIAFKSGKEKDLCLFSIVKVMIKNKSFDGALAVANRIDDDFFKERSLVEIATAKKSNIEPPDNAKATPDLDQSLERVAKMQRGKYDTASDLIFNREYSLANIAMDFAEIDTNKAIKIARSIKVNKYLRAGALAMIACNLDRQTIETVSATR